MLTDMQCRTAKPKEKAYKLTDGRGLFLEVRPNGRKAWRYRFALRDSEQTRCPVGRGIRENYMGFGLSTPDGQAFCLDRIEVMTAKSKTRRV